MSGKKVNKKKKEETEEERSKRIALSLTKKIINYVKDRKGDIPHEEALGKLYKSLTKEEKVEVTEAFLSHSLNRFKQTYLGDMSTVTDADKLTYIG